MSRVVRCKRANEGDILKGNIRGIDPPPLRWWATLVVHESNLLLGWEPTFVCHGHDVVTAEQTLCIPSDLITEAFLDD
jgi:hypothetical protein